MNEGRFVMHWLRKKTVRRLVGIETNEHFLHEPYFTRKPVPKLNPAEEARRCEALPSEPAPALPLSAISPHVMFPGRLPSGVHRFDLASVRYSPPFASGLPPPLPSTWSVLDAEQARRRWFADPENHLDAVWRRWMPTRAQRTKHPLKRHGWLKSLGAKGPLASLFRRVPGTVRRTPAFREMLYSYHINHRGDLHGRYSASHPPYVGGGAGAPRLPAHAFGAGSRAATPAARKP